MLPDFDLYGWGQSEGWAKPHQTSRSHRASVEMDCLMLDYLLTCTQTDLKRIGVNGGSGGGTHTILCRCSTTVSASAPTVNLACTSMADALARERYARAIGWRWLCNPELAAMFAPIPC